MLNHLGFFFFFCFFFFFFFSKVRVGAKEGGSHYWEMAVAITCGYGGYLLPLLAAHSSSYCIATTSGYDVSPWYWNFRRHCKLTVCGDGPTWKSNHAELLQHIAFQNKFIKRQTLIQGVLLDTSMFFYLNQVNWLFICWKQWSTALFTNCFMDPHVIRRALLHLRCYSYCDTTGSAWCTTVLGAASSDTLQQISMN